MDASTASAAGASSGTIRIKSGYTIDRGLLATKRIPLPGDTITPSQLDWSGVNIGSWITEEQQAKWRAEGRCESCGDLLPMSIHGLGECPKHPKPLDPNFRQ
jgi:hypothetical protein